IFSAFPGMSWYGLTEEVFEFEDAEVGLAIFAIDDAADRRDVHANVLGDGLVNQWLEEFLSTLEEPALVIDDGGHHAHHRFAALIDGHDKELRGFEFLLDEVLRLGIQRAAMLGRLLADEILIGGVHS